MNTAPFKKPHSHDHMWPQTTYTYRKGEKVQMYGLRNWCYFSRNGGKSAEKSINDWTVLGINYRQ